MKHMKAFLQFTLYADEETIRLLTLVESGEPLPEEITNESNTEGL
jgi:hypothetical protein